MINKMKTAQEAVAGVQDGMTIMDSSQQVPLKS